MARPPAVIIVVRHGARLDAADKQWHLTSPTPYDPPLTYGGWTQSRALGQRIASILRSREIDDDTPGMSEETGGNRRKRRHKVVIHTSPFLRCIQTSIAISAGLAQSPSHTQPRPASIHSSSSKVSQAQYSPKTRPGILTDSPSLAPIPEPANASANPYEQLNNIKKSTVRVDAFLGEWLTPDYFELITPPPSSVMMVAGAKADLLRREDYSNLIHTKDFVGTIHNKPFPGGWGSPIVAPDSGNGKDEGPLSNLSSLGQALQRRERTSSLGSVGTNGSHYASRSNTTPLPLPTEHGAYQPPIPSYAISHSNPIAPGYVAHARDACVDVDYQWDSMREPQNWGNGGEYGEEWSSMHKRFRNGIQQLVGWYNTNDDIGTALMKKPLVLNTLDEEEDTSGDEDTDLVVILVTHGAGCNALIGALTNQPVLLDVGMASLTMAVRKPTPVNSPTSTPGATPKTHSRASSKNVSISDQYEVKLVANTEHLRPSTSSTPTSSRPPSIAGNTVFRERFAGNSVSFDKSRPIMSSNFGSIRRTASIASSAPRSYIPARQSSIGLWSAPQPEEEASEEAEDDMILNFGNTAQTENKAEETKPAVFETAKDDDDEVAPLGLWGDPKPLGHADKTPDMPHKRRWTVNERG